MKKRFLLPVIALALAGLFCVLLLTLGSIEKRTDDHWSHIHMYMNDEITVNFPVTKADQPFVFQWETGRGSFSAEVRDAGGDILYSTASDHSGSAAFLASSDLTLQISADGHGGIFSLNRRDDLNLADDGQESEPRILVDGNHTGGQFTQTYECWKYDGKRLNFYVENLGSSPVRITINDSYNRIIPAGSGGHISAPISATVLAQKFTVQCVSTEGEEISIYWKVAQR